MYEEVGSFSLAIRENRKKHVECCGRREGAVGDTVASLVARLTLELAVRVRALAGDIVLCSWAGTLIS